MSKDGSSPEQFFDHKRIQRQQITVSIDLMGPDVEDDLSHEFNLLEDDEMLPRISLLELDEASVVHMDDINDDDNGEP